MIQLKLTLSSAKCPTHRRALSYPLLFKPRVLQFDAWKWRLRQIARTSGQRLGKHRVRHEHPAGM